MLDGDQQVRPAAVQVVGVRGLRVQGIRGHNDTGQVGDLVQNR
jgi:hypothetical protein